ncbi:hypothetical protein [Amycolatopsis sp. NPDC059657]|uniref:hypothetical protein n=1 Tax=Amycolatopsis sp. NPDC059657 TaxID=3346899 RepID=UPI00366DFF44
MVKKLASLLSASAALAGCITFGASTASASDLCAQTRLLPGNGLYITHVRITNVCSYPIDNVLGHVFNGPAHVDKYIPPRRTVAPGAYVQLAYAFTMPSGSLTCGEWQLTPNANFGRDCITRR